MSNNKLKVLVRGAPLTCSGYGQNARLVVDALMSQPDNFDVYVFPEDWGQTSWLFEGHPDQERLVNIVKKTSEYVQNGGTFDVSLQVTIPNRFERITPVNIGVTAGIECNHVSPQWLEKSNMMDKIIVVSDFAKQGFTGTNYAARRPDGSEYKLELTRPLDVIGYPVEDRTPDPSTLAIDFGTKFNFFTVAQWGPRKNLPSIITWFAEEFCDQEVGLVVKVNFKTNSMMDKLECEKAVNHLLAGYENRKCKVHLIHGDLTDEEMRGLFLHPQIKAYVCLSHGEGLGLGVFEAAYCGLPVIAPEWSGYLDFLYLKDGKKLKPAFARVDYRLDVVGPDAIWPGVIEEGTMWAYPQQGSYKMRLREVYKDYDRFKSQAKKLAEQVKVDFAKEKIYSAYCKSVGEFDVSKRLEEIL